MFTIMNPAPRHPAIAPVITLDGIVSMVGAVIGSRPNLSTDEEIPLMVSPYSNALKIASVNTANAQEKNTFQTTENFQKVLGFEIS